jgi:hypothetical protein
MIVLYVQNCICIINVLIKSFLSAYDIFISHLVLFQSVHCLWFSRGFCFGYSLKIICECLLTYPSESHLTLLIADDT